MELVELLNKVNDKKSFLEFVQSLIQDKSTNSEEWFSFTIEDYLDNANIWLKDSEREDISWKLMAEFLYFGKLYEYT